MINSDGLDKRIVQFWIEQSIDKTYHGVGNSSYTSFYIKRQAPDIYWHYFAFKINNKIKYQYAGTISKKNMLKIVKLKAFI